MFWKKQGARKKFAPHIDISNPKCHVITNDAYKGSPEVARIYRVDAAPGMPHYVILEAGKEYESGIAVFHRKPGVPSRKLEDREPLLVNASTRISLSMEDLPQANIRITGSNPSLMTTIDFPETARYEPQLDYRRPEELKEGDYDFYQFWLDGSSFEPGQPASLWQHYKPGAFKAFSLSMMEESMFLVANDGNLHILVATGDDLIRSTDTMGNQVMHRDCEYMERGLIFAYPDYRIFAGLSPVEPGIGFKLSDTLGKEQS